jgi:hypothetical protein
VDNYVEKMRETPLSLCTASVENAEDENF